ncbi:MAG: hypothetical protein GXO26_07300 [Crenarchaeota archaeon]|nr:hypothetical protein [Thermoproteota archaeon]
MKKRIIRIISIFGPISYIVVKTAEMLTPETVREIAEKAHVSTSAVIYATPPVIIGFTILIWILITIILAIILKFMRQSAMMIDVVSSSGLAFYAYSLYEGLLLYIQSIGRIPILYVKIIYLLIGVILAGLLIAIGLIKLSNMSTGRAVFAGIITTLIVYAITIVVSV